MRFALPAIILGFLAVLLYVGLGLNPRELPSPLIGKPVPQFDLPRLQDAEQRFTHTHLQGGIRLVNVWATWCGGCREEHHILLALKDAGIPIVGLNYKDTDDKAKQWLQQTGDPYTQVAVDADGRVAMDWGVYGVPETFVVDAQGIIQHKYVGPITPEIVKKDLLPRLKHLSQKPEHAS